MTSTDYGLTPSLSSEEARRWKEQITAQPYRNYLYSYPHKTAYREFQPPVSLEQLWLNEPAETFFLYMHIPFCGARCGFCNLFTLPDKRDDVHERYVDALERQARQWSAFTGHKPFARFAVGGGTPTLLAAPSSAACSGLPGKSWDWIPPAPPSRWKPHRRRSRKKSSPS